MKKTVRQMANEAYLKSGLSEEKVREYADKALRDVLVGYELMNAADFFFRRAKDYQDCRSLSTRFAEKHKVTRQTRLIEAAIKEFDISSMKSDGAIYEGLGDGSFDRIRKNAYEFARLIQVYYNKCQNPDAAKMVDKYLSRLSSVGLFSEEEILATVMR